MKKKLIPRGVSPGRVTRVVALLSLAALVSLWGLAAAQEGEYTGGEPGGFPCGIEPMQPILAYNKTQCCNLTLGAGCTPANPEPTSWGRALLLRQHGWQVLAVLP